MVGLYGVSSTNLSDTCSIEGIGSPEAVDRFPPRVRGTGKKRAATRRFLRPRGIFGCSEAAGLGDKWIAGLLANPLTLPSYTPPKTVGVGHRDEFGVLNGARG